MSTSITTSLAADPFLLELTSCISQQSPGCDCVGMMTYHGAEISCTNHAHCQQDQNLYRVCLGCMKKYCGPCFNDVHQHPLLNGCHSISWLSYVNSRDMYQRYGTPGPNNSKVMTVEQILSHYKLAFKKPRSAKHCRTQIQGLKEKFGGVYSLTFLEFLRHYTQTTVLFFTPVDVTETRRFHSLNACGRYWYSCYKRGPNSVNFLCFDRLLRRLQTDQGENVATVMRMMYHLLLVNFIGLIIYGLMLILPWALGKTTRDTATTVLSNFDWVGLTTGVNIDTLPIGFGGFPDSLWAPNDPSLRHFVVLLPIFVFLIFAVAALYTIQLILNNRQSLSETVSSPALLGNVSTTVFTMLEHNMMVGSKGNTRAAGESFHANVMMSLIKKFNPDQKQTAVQKFKSRNIFVMLLSCLLILGAAGAVFCIDYFGLSTRYGQRYLHVGINFQQLIFPAVFWIIKYLTEQISIWLVKHEIPKKIHLYNRFRSVLFYRLSFLNVSFLISLIVVSFFHQNDTNPPHRAINVSRQIELGYCSDESQCFCPAQILGMFWYRILVVGFYFEFIMMFLSILRTILTRCCYSKNSTFLFSPIPRLTQFYFIQALVWASILYLPASPVLGFLIMFVGWFFSYFKTQVLKYKPLQGVYLLPSKIQFYFSFITLILIGYVPSAILLSQHPNCGPFVSSTASNLNAFGLFTDAATDFPVVIKEIFSYGTNPLVLWLIIIAVITMIISLSQVTTVAKKDRNKLLSRLKIESHERALLIKRCGIDYFDDDYRGEELFIAWMNNILQTPLEISGSLSSEYYVSPTLLHSYLKRIHRKHPSFITLSKHNESQLKAIFQACGTPSHIAEILCRSFMDFARHYRNQQVLRQKRVI